MAAVSSYITLDTEVAYFLAIVFPFQKKNSLKKRAYLF